MYFHLPRLHAPVPTPAPCVLCYVALRRVQDFGPMVALGFGGVLVEELKRIMRPNRAQIFLPACMDLAENESLLAQLPLVRMIEGKVGSE